MAIKIVTLILLSRRNYYVMSLTKIWSTYDDLGSNSINGKYHGFYSSWISLKHNTLCSRHGSDKFFCLGLLIMNYETFLYVQSEFMLKTIPAWYLLLVIFQIYFFTTIKNDQKTINFIYFCSNSILPSILPHPKPSFMHLTYSKQS